MLTQNNPDITVFDRMLVQKRRERCRKNFSNYDFLFAWCRDQIADRLLDVARDFQHALHIGSRCPIDSTHTKVNDIHVLDLTPEPVSTLNKQNYVQADEEFLPVKEQSLDLILSNLTLHSVNDLPGTLVQIRKSLAPDGLFIGAMLGGETLYELRDIMNQVEIELYGGMSPHISPFADKPQMGDLLQRAGFKLPVVDSEIICVTYEHAFKLFKDLRGMGESNSIHARNRRPLGKDFFMRCAQKYQENYADDDGRITASFEIIFLLGWSEHSSQQKPLKPGSATHSLAEVLGTTEIKT